MLVLLLTNVFNDASIGERYVAPPIQWGGNEELEYFQKLTKVVVGPCNIVSCKDIS